MAIVCFGMRKTPLSLLPLVLVLGACDTIQNDPYGTSGYPPQPYPAVPPEPYPPAYHPPGSGDYRAMGTEPFWDLTISRDMVFTDRGTGMTVVQPTPQPIGGTAGPIYRTQRLEVNVVHSPCSDGMSDRRYPDRVQVYVDGRLYRGCGGAAAMIDPVPPGSAQPPPPISGMPAPPLDRTRWTVVAINGRPVPSNGEYSMEFDAGRMSARFGCNSIGAGYTQAGSTIDAGALITTRMGCPDMSWESQGSAVIDRPMQVNALDRNRITLTSSGGSIELLRRP